MRNALTFSIGLIFGLGLVVGGMNNPAKVLNFFDIAGHWDPSLALVMAAALAVTGVGYRIVFTRGAPFAADKFTVPTSRSIDVPLVAGAAVFGIGWGLGGLCPGGVLSMLASGHLAVIVFVAAMLSGMWLTRTFNAARTPVVGESAST